MKDVCLCIEKSTQDKVVVHSIGINRGDGTYYSEEHGGSLNLTRKLHLFTYVELTWGEFKNYIDYSILPKNKTTKYLVEIESGKNNIGGMTLSILKDSRIVTADSAEDAYSKAFKGDTSIPYVLAHFGHDPDYQKVTNISRIKD